MNNKMQILCVEDDKTTAALLRGLLEKWNYEPLMAENGGAALDMVSYSKNIPQLILTDWMMPEVNGLELIKKLKALCSDKYLYFIILSSRSQKNDIVEGLNAGANDYILKPFDPNELRCRVRIGMETILLQNTLKQQIIELQTAIQRIKTLEGLIPICMYCKKIRTPDNYWEQIERYIENHSDAKFTHGICNECMQTIMKENKLKE